MGYKDIENFLNDKKPEAYDFKNEADIKYYRDMSPPERYIVYKASAEDCKHSVYFNGKSFAEKVQTENPQIVSFDCDGSGEGSSDKLCILSRNIYRALWDWKDSDGKSCARYAKCNEEIFNNMGPDTMNSAQKLIDLFLDDIIYKKENKDMLEIKNGKISINYLIELYSNEKTGKRIINELNGIPYLTEYLEEYHKIGNFTLVPAYFNAFRNSMVNDYWYSSLELLKNKNSSWNCRKNPIKWDPKNYDLYINFFFMWDYIDENGCPVDYSDILNSSRSEYMKHMIRAIKRRSIFMVMLLKINKAVGDENYGKMRKSLFCRSDGIYRNYEEVMLKIKKYLFDNNCKMLDNVIEEAYKSITAI